MANIIAATRSKVRSYLKDIYGSKFKQMVLEIDDAFVVLRGSAAVHVKVKPLAKDECVVQALAYVVHGAKITPKLLNLLMTRNARSPIGAFGLMFDDTITFSHSIAGTHLDPNELRLTVATVAFIADETDDEIRKIAGGMRAVDANAAIMLDAAAPATPAAKSAGKTAPKGKTAVPAARGKQVKKKKPAAGKK